MNSQDSRTSDFIRMLTDMYERAHIAVALLDSTFCPVWCSTQALFLWPLLTGIDSAESLLDGFSLADVRGEIAHCGFFCTPGGIGNLFAMQPAVIYAAPPECGEHYLLQPASDSRRPFSSVSNGLRPEGLMRSVSSFESHYRAPISSIFSTLSVLRREMDKNQIRPELTPYFASLQQNAFDLLRSTQMVSEYTRLSNGMLSLQLRYVELYGFLRALLRNAASLAETPEMPLRYTVPSGTLETLCDLDRLNAVLLHLISNACRFTRPGNCITVRVRRIRKRIIISVSDKGAGMSESTLMQAFQPYFSYSQSGDPFAGNGLGLAIAQKSAALLGGTLTLTSIEGKGTTATFSLPILEPEPHAAVTLESEPPAYSNDRFSVLRIILSDSVCYPF